MLFLYLSGVVIYLSFICNISSSILASLPLTWTWRS